MPHPFWKKKKKSSFPQELRFSKTHASICKLGAFGHASFIFKKRSSSSSFQKKKKKIKISKNHASISKLRAFGHASSILKKEEIIFSSNIKVFISHASICKLGAYGHASFIFKKEDHHHHLSKKKIKISKNHAPFLN